MAFRDHLGAADVVSHPVSLIHGMWEYSKNNNHPLLLFENITETPGHRAAVNLLTRERLCAAIGITPEEYIDTLAWAMENPTSPVVVGQDEAECFENSQDNVDLEAIPIPHHWPQDRGRYSSASVIIAQYNGIRNMSFHRQFLRDKNHTVVRLVPRHLRTMMIEARANGETVDVAVVNAPDPVVLLAAAMSFSENIDELTIAAALHEKLYDKPLRLTTTPNGVEVPASAEYVFWGKITLDNDDEGPYVCLLYTSPSPRDPM